MRERVGLTLLRVSMGVVFLIFGVGKFQGDVWAQTIESMEIFQRLPWPTGLTVKMIGTAECLIGGLWILGLWRRWVSVAAALQLLTILFLLQFQEVRDIGLLGAAVYLALVSGDSYGLETLGRNSRGISGCPKTPLP